MHNPSRFTTVEASASYYKKLVKFQFFAWLMITSILLIGLATFQATLYYRWTNLDKVWQQHAVLYDKWKQAHLASIKEFEKAMTAEEQKYAKFEEVLKTAPTPAN